MQPMMVLIIVVWVLIMAVLAVAGAAFVLGVRRSREHRALDTGQGDALAVSRPAAGMTRAAVTPMTGVAAAAASASEDAASVEAAAAGEFAPSPPAQQPTAPAGPTVPVPSPALPFEPAWNSHFAKVHRSIDGLPAARGDPEASRQAG